MNLTLMVKLQPSPEQTGLLLKTVERFNAACNCIAQVAFREKTSNKVRLQKVVYSQIRSQFGLSAQMTIRAISKVCEAYKRDQNVRPRFKPHGAVPFDQRNMSWKGTNQVSLLTLSGREIIPCVVGRYQEQRLGSLRGQVDLIIRDGLFLLAVVVDQSKPALITAEQFLGVDLGIKNIAADSDGDTYSGRTINGLRRRHSKLRAKLQTKGTKSAKRLLAKRRRKESRFAANVNHVISKRLVAKAKGTGRGIALENLQGIRYRITVKKAQRRIHHCWSFHQLRLFVTYKAALAGVPVVLVDPRNTSRTCPKCGVIDKASRLSRDMFRCVSCGHAGPADTIAAVNICRRAAVNQPNAG